MTAPLDLDALENTVGAMRLAGVSGVTISVDEADALIAAARERDALRVDAHGLALVEAVIGQRGMTDCSTPVHIQVQNVLAEADHAAAECQAREQAEREAKQEAACHSQTLAERDQYHDAADNLAHAIVRLCIGEGALDEEVIGEHSNANDPWESALALAEACLGEREATDAMRTEEIASLKKRVKELAAAMTDLHRAQSSWTLEFQPGGKYEGALMLGGTISVEGGKWLVARVAWLEERSDRLTTQLSQVTEQAEQREARLIGVLKEYEEADVNDGIMQERLTAANDRADALYRQYEANRDDEELQARRRENLDDCLRLADVASQARRRKQAARQAIKAALIDAALAEGQDG